MNKIIKRILIVILFIGGLSLLCYPFIANQWNNYRQNRLISDYDQTVAAREAAGEIDYQAEREAAISYNNDLLPSILPDSFAIAEATETDSRYMSCLNIAGNGMMGTVEIPKIDITLPLYHTTADDILQIAAGHLEGSSLPVGGENTHAVISAHRGLPSASLFTDLDKLEETDHFLLHILDETLCYEVDKITVIEPEDTKDLVVEDGKDLVTLMTCTPYGVNSHRLLVRGHRVPYVEEDLADEKLPLSNMSLHTNYLLWIFVGIAVAAIFSYILYRREKKRGQSQPEEKEVPAGTTGRVLITENVAEELLPTENQTSGNRTAENQTTENQTTENETAENETTENETAENQTTENETAELPVTENGTEESMTAEKETEEVLPEDGWPYQIRLGDDEWPDEVQTDHTGSEEIRTETDDTSSEKEQP